MMTTVSTEHTTEPNIILHSYHQFEFGDCACCEKPNNKKEYIPIFGVGGLTETSIWAAHARPIKFTTYAINYYNLTNREPGLDSKRGPEDKPGVIPRSKYLIGKKVGVVRRIVENGTKIDKYHCPTYELISIELPHMYNICTAKIRCYETGQTEDVVIDRLAIPSLLEYT